MPNVSDSLMPQRCLMIFGPPYKAAGVTFTNNDEPGVKLRRKDESDV